LTIGHSISAAGMAYWRRSIARKSRPIRQRATHPRLRPGYLREAYVKPRAVVGYRCPGEPVGDYVATVDLLCLCNGLAATVRARPAAGRGR
jgi:hypothetical protein